MIDKKLDPIYGCVQGGHCVAEFMKKFPGKWNNEYLIYLYADIDKWFHKLNYNRIEYAYFREPDLNNKVTSIAVLNHRDWFRHLKLIN